LGTKASLLKAAIIWSRRSRANLLVIVRDKGGEVHGFYNVCRHPWSHPTFGEDQKRTFVRDSVFVSRMDVRGWTGVSSVPRTWTTFRGSTRQIIHCTR
jgi:hypothetical protein